MNAVAPVKPITAAAVAVFVRAHLPEAATWPEEKILPWVSWFMRKDRALVVTDDADEIAGVALGRFISRTEEVEGHALYDEPAGRILWIDGIVAKRPEVIPQMLRILAAKWGDRDFVAGLCFLRSGELRMFPMKHLTRFFGT